MKKIMLLIIGVLLVEANLRAQDYIFLPDGEKIQAKIVEVSETEVRYKKWNNLNGPTWVKKLSEIERIKYQKDRMPVTFKQGEYWDFKTCRSMVAKPQKRQVSGNEIVEQIDRYYSDSLPDKIKPYISKLPSYINRNCIHQYYLEYFYRACDDEEVDDIIKYGELYLNVGGELYLPSVLPMVAKMYVTKGNNSAVDKLTKDFEQYSKANDDFFSADIEQMNKEINDLLNPWQMEEAVKGVWVMIDERNPYEYKVSPKKREKLGKWKFSPKVLNIVDARNIVSGARFLESNSEINIINYNGKRTITFDNVMNTSQHVFSDGKNRMMAIEFASEQIKDNTWLTEVASVTTEGVRKMGAELQATILSASDLKPMKKLGVSLASDIIVTGVANLLSELNYSVRHVEDYKFFLYPSPENENVIQAKVSHVSVNINNEGRANYDNTYQDEDHLFVRWEESDSVIFVSTKNFEPITLAPFTKEDSLMREYYKIKKQTSFWAPQCSIPFFAGNALAGYFMYASIKSMVKEDNVGKFAGFFTASLTTMMVSCIVPSVLITKKRGMKYGELNGRSLEKLRKKAQTELSIIPVYNPVNNEVGASLNFKF